MTGGAAVPRAWRTQLASSAATMSPMFRANIDGTFYGSAPRPPLAAAKCVTARALMGASRRTTVLSGDTVLSDGTLTLRGTLSDGGVSLREDRNLGGRSYADWETS